MERSLIKEKFCHYVTKSLSGDIGGGGGGAHNEKND